MHIDGVVDEGTVEIGTFLQFQQMVIGHVLQWLVGFHPYAEWQAESLFLLVDSAFMEPVLQGLFIEVAQVAIFDFPVAGHLTAK